MDDTELRRRLEVLRTQMEDGKVHFASHLAEDIKASLGAVRYGQDGELDLTTVNGRVRSLAMAVTVMKDREEIKNIQSLREVQIAYFDSIRNNFGEIFDQMVKSGQNPHSWSFVLSRNSENVDYLYPIISKFIESIVDFWQNGIPIVTYHLQDLQVVKGIFGGDLFPSYTKNIASTCGLYLDTIILTDPFMNSRDLFLRWKRDESVRYFIKHAMNLLTYYDLAVADVDIPIVAVVPFESSIDDDQRELIGSLAEMDAVAHGSKIFGREFGSRDEFQEFVLTLETAEAVLKETADSDRLLFDLDWKEPKANQIDRALTEFGSISGASNAGTLVLAQCFGRMMQATDILVKSHSFGGTPLIDAPTSWQYLNWKLEYGASKDDHDVPLHMLHGLQRAGRTDLEWIGNIPSAALIEIRQQGALEEIRATLAKGIDELTEMNPTNFFRTSDKIVENVEGAFEIHQRNLDELRHKNLKFWGHDIGTWVVSGSIGIAAALTSGAAYGLAALATDQVFDIPKLRELPGQFKQLREQKRILSGSPMGLLFQHKK